MLVGYCHANMHNHSFYAYKFFLCEVLNFINVVGQIYFTDRFLGYEFTTYGTRVISMSEEDDELRSDPMNLVFPKVSLVCVS